MDAIIQEFFFLELIQKISFNRLTMWSEKSNNVAQKDINPPRTVEKSILIIIRFPAQENNKASK